MFGGQAPANQSGYYSPLSQPLGNGAIAALGIDLRGLANTRIVTQVSGTAPNRNFIVQWQNIGIVRYSDAPPSDTVNFQIRLEETSNAVSIGYGTFGMSAEGGSFDTEVGLRADSEVNARETQPATDDTPNPWAASTASASGDSRCRLTLVEGTSGQILRGVPQNNLVFAWSAAATLPTPTLLSPGDGATTTLPQTFRWNPVQGATSYEFQLIAPGGGTYNPLTVQTTSVEFSSTVNAGYTSAMLGMPGVFSWRIQAVGAGGLRSPVSETRRFTPRAQPVIKSITERTFIQGRSATTVITAEHITFSANALPSVQFTPTNAQGFSGTVTVNSPTTLSVSVNVPADAAITSYNLQVVAGQDTLRLSPAISVVSSANPPLVSEFSPTVHGFNFCNCGFNMWDETIYANINYNSPAYPAEVRALNPQPQDFPSWDDFVTVYERGTGQSAYLGTGATRNAAQEALNEWRTSKKAWGGSCGGFAITALMAYSGKYTFSAPAYQIAINNNLRALINRNQVSQGYGTLLGSFEDTPNQTVQKIRANFTQPKADQFLVAIFNIVNGENKGGHALVPYKIVTTTAANGDIIDNVYSWDMNYPGDTERIVIVNRTKNTWQYFGFLNTDEIMQGAPPWQGSTGFFPYLSANSAAAVPQLPVLAGKSSHSGSVLANTPKNNPPVEVYFFDDNEAPNALAPRVTTTNRFNQSVANFGPYMLTPQIPGARVELPISTGANVDAPGMTIPQQPINAYRIQYKPTNDGSENFIGAYWKQLSAYSYWVAPSSNGTQSLDLDFDRDAVRFIATAKAESAELTIAKTDPTDTVWQNTISLFNLQMNTGDSIDVRLVNDGNSILITNFGAPRTFALYMERYDTTSFYNLRIGAKESQTLLIEDWDNIGTCDIMVQLDRGLNNKLDTTYFLRRNGITTNIKQSPVNDVALLRFEVYPNPANTEVNLTYVLPSANRVTVEMLNLFGQRVALAIDGQQSIGRHNLQLATTNLPSGVYICRITTGNRTATQLVRVVR